MAKSYNDILEEIGTLNIRLTKLTNNLQKVCKHPNVSRQEGKEDHGWDVVCYRCLHCGKYFTFDSRRPQFERKVQERRYFFRFRKENWKP